MDTEQFVVRPEALRGYAGLLERNLGHVTAMKQHLVGWGYQTADLHGVMGMFVGEIERIADWQCDLLDRIHQKLGDTTHGLRATADTYANTDAALPATPALDARNRRRVAPPAGRLPRRRGRCRSPWN